MRTSAYAALRQHLHVEHLIAHERDGFHRLDHGNVVRDLRQHWPSRYKLALEELEVIDELLMMPIALAH